MSTYLATTALAVYLCFEWSNRRWNRAEYRRGYRNALFDVRTCRHLRGESPTLETEKLIHEVRVEIQKLDDEARDA